MKRTGMWCCGLLFAVLLAMAPFNCYAAKKTSTIKIGIDLDLTGPIGPGGIDMQKGLNLGLEKLGNEIPGKKIVFIYEDNGSNAGESVDKAKLLVETDKVAMIIGPINGGGTVAVGQYLDRMHVPALTGMAASTDDAGHKWTFCDQGLQSQYGYGLGVYAANVLHYKTAVELSADYLPGHRFVEGFKVAFEQRGGKVIQQTYYPEGSTNFIPYLTALKKADTFVFWGTPGDCFAMFPQYKSLNLKMPIIQPEDGGVTSSPGMLAHLGKAAIGTVFGTGYLYNANYPGNKAFVEAYKKKYHELPGVMAGVGYQHVQLLMAALKATHGNVEPDVLYKALKHVSVETVRGLVRFPSDAGPYGTIADLPYTMGKIGPNMQVEPILPVKTIGVRYKNKKFIPFVYPAK